MPATITYRARIKVTHDEDGNEQRYVQAPVIAVHHVNGVQYHNALHRCANTISYPGILARIGRRYTDFHGRMFLHNLPPEVTVTEGFLATVTIQLADDILLRD